MSSYTNCSKLYEKLHKVLLKRKLSIVELQNWLQYMQRRLQSQIWGGSLFLPSSLFPSSFSSSWSGSLLPALTLLQSILSARWGRSYGFMTIKSSLNQCCCKSHSGAHSLPCYSSGWFSEAIQGEITRAFCRCWALIWLPVGKHEALVLVQTGEKTPQLGAVTCGRDSRTLAVTI